MIRDRKDYLIEYDWPESYKAIIGELDMHALARIQNETGGQIPMDKFTLNTAINALRNVRNETITTRQIYNYGGISGMAIGIIVAGACIVFACYTCFTRTPSERTLRQSHPQHTNHHRSDTYQQPGTTHQSQSPYHQGETQQEEHQTTPWSRTAAF
jgi:hypothetical protein